MENPFSLDSKAVLVTGASSGIGKGIAIACSRMGARVVINGRNEQRLQETMTEMEGSENLLIAADLCNMSQLSEMVAKLPKLDGIVHCAGIGQRVLCKQLQEANIDSVMNVNFKAPVMLQTEILKQKKISSGASVVFIASIASWSPSFGNSIYSASKGAIVSYSNCLALELAPRKIRVNCISPAMVWTDLITKDGIDMEALRLDEQNYPLKRYGTPEDIAGLALYMLSDVSSWMTGSNVKISGGGKLS